MQLYQQKCKLGQKAFYSQLHFPKINTTNLSVQIDELNSIPVIMIKKNPFNHINKRYKKEHMQKPICQHQSN